MKLSNLKKLVFFVSLTICYFSCNQHCKPATTQTKEPELKNPASSYGSIKDSVKPEKTVSDNREFDQNRIDSLKATKPKPRSPGKNKNN